MATEARPPRWSVDDVLARTDLTGLLDELAEPASTALRGRRWHCPVAGHDDRHASVSIHTDARGHQRWRCWSGDDTHRGDAIDLVRITRNLEHRDALDWLARRAHLSPDQPLPPPARRPTPPAQIMPLDPLVTQYAQACEQILWTATGRPVLDWLRQRGIDDATMRANHLGADPGRQLLHRRGGLPWGHQPGAVFPALDPDGQIRYLQTRYLDPDPPTIPKYDNPASSLGSNPRLAWTQPTQPPEPGVLVCCEGIPDALIAAQAGYRAVGVLGSQASDGTVAARLATHAARHDLALVAIPDADPAGRAWASRLQDLLDSHHQDLVVIDPPAGHDLTSWAANHPNWHQALAQLPAKTLVEPVPVELGEF